MEFPLYPNDDYDRERAAEDAKHLRAVKILDAWAKKHEEATPPTPIFHRYMSPVPGRGMVGCWLAVLPNLMRCSASTAAEARIAAAAALAKEDPSLLEGLE